MNTITALETKAAHVRALQIVVIDLLRERLVKEQSKAKERYM